jgi:hypothetical protein
MTLSLFALASLPAALTLPPDLAGALTMIVGTALSSLLFALLTRLLQMWNIRLSAERQAQAEHIVALVVRSVEESAATYLRTHGIPLTGQAKLERAVTDIVTRLPRVSRTEAAEIVHAVLPALGLGATAGLGKLGDALRTPDDDGA